MVDSNGNYFLNRNKIPLSVAVYSSENPPKLIEHSNIGNYFRISKIILLGKKIIQGSTERDLVNGLCHYDKIQVKEVTSHFRNGWVFLVVYPRLNS